MRAAAAGIAPDGAELLVPTIKDVPLYDGDAEAATDIPLEVHRDATRKSLGKFLAS